MSFSYDLSTDAGKLRLLIMDVDRERPDFSDEELAVFLSMETSLGLKGAAALALVALSADQSRIAIRKERLGLTDDLTKVADNLRTTATALRDQAIAESTGGAGLYILSPSWTPRDLVRNIALDGATVTDYTQRRDSSE